MPEGLRDAPLLRNAMKWVIGLSLVVAVAFPLLPYFKSNQFLLGSGAYLRPDRGVTHHVGWLGGPGQSRSVRFGGYRCLSDGSVGRRIGWSMVEILIVAGLVGAIVMVVIGLPSAPGAGPDPRRDDTWPGSNRSGLALSTVVAGWNRSFQR